MGHAKPAVMFFTRATAVGPLIPSRGLHRCVLMIAHRSWPGETHQVQCLAPHQEAPLQVVMSAGRETQHNL